MTTIRTSLAALALLASSSPAFAGLISSALVADVYAPADIDLLSMQFELRDLRSGEVSWTLPATIESVGRGSYTASYDLGRGSWTLDDDLVWCLVVDASRTRSAVELDALEVRVDDGGDDVLGSGRDIGGDVGELCVTGTSR